MIELLKAAIAALIYPELYPTRRSRHRHGRRRGYAIWCLCFAALAGTLVSRVEAASSRPLVFVPGIMGSRLCTNDGVEETVIWGTLGFIRDPHALRVHPDDGVYPCGIIERFQIIGPLQQDTYAPILSALEEQGYEVGQTLFLFDYDWRLSVFENAQRLSAFVETNIPEGQFDILAHSMGGIIAKIYALELNGADRITKFVTAGTPWHGSARVMELLGEGYGAASMLVGGQGEIRRTLLSMPAIYDLMPRYGGCCFALPDAEVPQIALADPESWSALGWEGLAPHLMPTRDEYFQERNRLDWIVSAALPDTVDVAMAIGIDRRTPSQFEVIADEKGWEIAYKRKWSGDGTVLPESSLPVRGTIPVYKTRLAAHPALLNDPDVQAFVKAVLEQDSEAAIAQVPPQERDAVETSLGELVSLLGAVVETPSSVYGTSDRIEVSVILRPEGKDPIASKVLRLIARYPDGSEQSLALTFDAGGTGIPFEQVFRAEISAGQQPGALTLSADIDVEGRLRREEARVLVLAR